MELWVGTPDRLSPRHPVTPSPCHFSRLASSPPPRRCGKKGRLPAACFPLGTVMGIYDRDYYRKEGPSVLDSFAVKGQMVKWLLAINIAMFIVQLLTRNTPERQFVALIRQMQE